MRQEIIAKSTIRRVSLPANLLMVGLVGGMFCLFGLATPEPGIGFLSALLPFILLFGHLALSPVPWQWTGDDADRAELGRGFIPIRDDHLSAAPRKYSSGRLAHSGCSADHER